MSSSNTALLFNDDKSLTVGIINDCVDLIASCLSTINDRISESDIMPKTQLFSSTITKRCTF